MRTQTKRTKGQIAIGKVDGELVDENGFYLGSETKREIVRRYNHAERLAEALRGMVESPNSFSARQKAIEALAAWEGAK